MNRRGLGNIFAPNDGAMKPFSQKLPFAKRDILIQGDSVRQIWGMEEPGPEEERRAATPRRAGSHGALTE